MAIVVKDIIEGANQNESGQGVTATRVFHVSGVTGSPSTKMASALGDPRIPKLGEVHPSSPTIFCTNRDINFSDSSNARVTCSYKIPDVFSGDLPEGSQGAVSVPPDDISGQASTDQGTIQLSATGATFTTDLDIFGEQMIVAHNVKVNKPGDSVEDEFGRLITPQIDKRNEQVQTAEYSRPSLVLRVTRLEKGSPDEKARRYVGAVNLNPIGNDPPRSWLCTRIDGQTNDGGDEYRVTYEFQYNKDLWIFVGVWIDPTTKLPVKEADFNTEEEFKAFQIYDEIDFGKLGIKFEGVVGAGKTVFSERKAKKANDRLKSFAKSAPSSFDELFK